MKEPGILKKQMETYDEQIQPDDLDQKNSSESVKFHQWAKETIVVNGQPMIVTFPLDEES